ncbi:MAG TPA: Crp/Fnr family transcriptional regulator [Acidimicrobiales bacterium]
MSSPSDVLALTRDLPERRLDVGEVLFGKGGGGDAEVAVLIEGALRVELDDILLAQLSIPGSFVGEIGALLGTARSATVVAAEPSTVRLIGDPDAFFASHPEISLELARQLAGRLHRLLAYLTDLRGQYAGAEGHLTMVDSVLGRLAARPPVDIDPGSDRSPDY